MWQRRRLTQLDLLERIETAPAPDPEERKIRGLVREALGRLSAAQREVIVHHYLKGYSYRQTAALLDLKTDTVRSRLQKARSRLQKEIIAMSESSCTQIFELTAADLAGLRHLARFQADDPDRSILECVCLDAGGRMVACDGARLLNWSSAGLISLASPVILGSVDSEAVPQVVGSHRQTHAWQQRMGQVQIQQGLCGKAAPERQEFFSASSAGRICLSGAIFRSRTSEQAYLGLELVHQDLLVFRVIHRYVDEVHSALGVTLLQQR